MKTRFWTFTMLFIISMFSVDIYAQLMIADNGNVGIKCSAPLSKLSIGANGLSNARLYVYSSLVGNTGSGSQYGIYSSFVSGTHNDGKFAVMGYCKGLSGYMVGVKGEAAPSNTNLNPNVTTYGVYGIAGNANNGKNYGVYGTLRDPSTYPNGAGVCGTTDKSTPAISGRYAGYFYGNTYVNGNIYTTNLNNTSDARLKTNIIDVKKDAISKVKELHPVQFRWQQVEDVIVEDTVTIKVPHFSSDIDFTREHYGLLAQEVQKLFPELVDKDGAGYLSVNYVELIPLLIQAVQELSAEVEEIKSYLTNSQKIKSLSRNNIEKAELIQNTPNPFSQTTTISYYLPIDTQEAAIHIYDMKGTEIATYPISTLGQGELTIDGGTLHAGMYLYSLIADGYLIDTKHMILTM